MNKFPNLGTILDGIPKKNPAAKIVKNFVKLTERKSGWHRGSADYYIDENGKAKCFNDVKIVSCGQVAPVEFFKEIKIDANPPEETPYPSSLKEFDGVSDYISISADNKAFEFGTGNFTIEGWLDNFQITSKGADISKLAPDDGDWHSVSISRKGTRTFTHTQEKINDVLYVVMSEYKEDGSLVERKYTRADLVKG